VSRAPAAPRTGFDWPIYADATFAGLSVLIPVPFVDSVFEWYFSQRIPAAIARRRARRLQPEVVSELIRSERDWLATCLLLPFILIVQLVKRLSKKVLYFLTVKSATDRLSFYWHQAFLLDYALQQGHLDTPGAAYIARKALEEALRGARTSPLEKLAAQLVTGSRRIWRSLRRARRGQEDEVMARKRSIMARAWEDFAGYFQEVAVRYDATYDRVLAARLAAAEQQASKPEGTPP
jgi:hypothetical protein